MALINKYLPFLVITLLVFNPSLVSGRQAENRVIKSGLLERAQAGEKDLRVIVVLDQAEALAATPVSSDPAAHQSLQSLVSSSQKAVITRISPAEMKVTARLENIPLFAATVTPKGLLALANIGGVAQIQEDRPVYPCVGKTALETNALPDPRARADLYSGRNVSIAIVGSGIDYENETMGGGGFPNSKVIGGYDFGDEDEDPLDCHGHETGVAYVAGYKVAPQAKLYALKICPGCCETEPSWVSKMLAAWDWCITHKEDNPAYPITAINISWADYTHNTSQCDQAYQAEALAAAACKSAGIAIFAAAGNENLCDGMPMPACLSEVISVGAVYDEKGSTMTYCLPYQACSSWPSSACGGWSWACRDDVVIKDQVSCCSNSAEFLSLLAPCGGYTSGSAPHAAGASAVLQSYLREKEGDYRGVDEMMEILFGYCSAILDFKSFITTPRIDVDEMIQGLEAEKN